MNEIANYNVTGSHIESGNYVKDSHQIDFLQTHLKCCGIESYLDWENNFELDALKSVPDSCCKVPSLNCGLRALEDKFILNTTSSTSYGDNPIYLFGCINQSKELFSRNCLIVGLIVISVFGLQIITIILSWCLSEQMREGKWWRYSYNKKPYHKRNYY